MQTRHYLLLGLVLAAVAGAAYRLASPPGKETVTQKLAPPVPVTVAAAVARDMPVLLEVVGRGEAYASVTLKSRVDGQVIDLPFREGQPVARGDVLVRLDPADFEARLAQAEANLTRDQALLRKARADLERYQALQAQGFVAEEKVAELRAAAEAAEATVRADQAALELARLQCSYTTVRAPFAGVAGDKHVHPGAAVKLNETELVTLKRVQPLYVSFAVAERHLPALRAARAAGRLQIYVRAPEDRGPGKSAELRFIDPAVDSASGTLRMKAELANADGALAPGQYLQVSLQLDLLRAAVSVPAEAVQQGPDGPFVYVVGAEQATLRKVTLGPVREGFAVITHGLEVGETVVTDGHSRLVPGGRVKLRTPGGKPAGTPSGNSAKAG